MMDEETWLRKIRQTWHILDDCENTERLAILVTMIIYENKVKGNTLGQLIEILVNCNRDWNKHIVKDMQSILKPELRLVHGISKKLS